MTTCIVTADIDNMRGKVVLVFLRPMRAESNIRIHAWQTLALSAGAHGVFEFDPTISLQVMQHRNETRTSSGLMVLHPGQLALATRPSGLSPQLSMASTGNAHARLTHSQVGVRNQTLPPATIDCIWHVGGRPMVTAPDVDQGMTCTFEYEPTLFFMVAAEQVSDGTYTVQSFTDMTRCPIPLDCTVLRVDIRYQRHAWHFVFDPEYDPEI